MVTDSPDGLLIFGHRGAAGLAPENTLASFARAVALGVDGVELDVQLADGELVVIHDADVARTTNGTGSVAALSFAELRRLDAGDGQTIPTLGEVLAAVPSSIMVNIELKGPATAEPVAQLVAGLQRPLLVSSFDHGELTRFHERLPTTPCAPLASRWRSDLEAVARRLQAWSVNLADRAVTPARVADVRRWGCRCLVYTVNDAARARRLRALGVAGVFTDYPGRF